MLQLLRDKAQSTFIQIIVVIIALVFIFWGVGTNMMGSRQSALEVNGEEISFQQYQRAYDNAFQRISDQFGGNIPKGLAETLGIKQQVINQLVQATLLRQGGEEMGLIVSSDEIRDIIKEMIQFQDNGAFSIDKYNAILASNRLAPTKFESSMRFDKLSERAAREINNFATVATDFEIQDIFDQINKQVSVDYAKISPSSFTDRVEIDDKVLSEWFQTVKDQYKSAPEIKLSYLAFTYDSVGKKIEIDEPEIKKYYQANPNNYKIAEQRHARHILFKAEKSDSEALHSEKAAKAAEVLLLAKNGADFAELAKKYSEGPSASSGGDLGFFEQGNMVPPFDSAVFSLEPGGISEIVKTRFGYHIISLEDVKPADTRPLAEVRNSIIKTLQKKQAENIAFQVANSAYEGIIGAGSLDNYAKENPDAEVLETEFFTRTEPPKFIGADQNFLNSCLALNKNELSSLVKGRTGYAIFYAEDIIPPVVPPLAQIKDRLQADYREKKSQELAQKAAEELLAAVSSGAKFKTIAQEQGYEVTDSGYLSQKTPDKNGAFPSELLSQAFLLSSASPLPKEAGQVGDDYYVYSFTGSHTPELPQESDDVEQLKKEILNFKRQQLLSSWLMNAERNAKISQNPSLR